MKKKTTVRLFAALMVLLLLFPLSACAPVDPDAPSTCTITEIDGRFFLNLSNGNELSERELALSSIGGPLMFDSFAEMRQTFAPGNVLTEYQRGSLRSFPKTAECGIHFFDMDHLYVPVLPVEFDRQPQSIRLDYSSLALWEGETIFHKSTYYSAVYRLAGNENITAETFFYHSAAEFEHLFTLQFSRNFSLYEDAQISYEEERNATVYQGEDLVRKHYVIHDGERELNVQEIIFDTGINVLLFVQKGDLFYSISIQNLTERPSVDWLLSFGIEPYADNAAA